MKIEVRKSFEKDVIKLSDKKLATRLYLLIEQLETCKTISEIKSIKKMAGTDNYYRVRIGNYRLGIKIEKGTILLLRFMHRKEIYTFFP